MSFVYLILLFTGYLSIFASVTIYSTDFPTDYLMKVILLMGLCGAVLVHRSQVEIDRKIRVRNDKDSTDEIILSKPVLC